MSSAKWRQFLVGLNVLNGHERQYIPEQNHGHLQTLFQKNPKQGQFCVLIQISLKFVPVGRFDNKSNCFS